MQAKDIMETMVQSVPPEMSLHEFEEFLSQEGISGAPVKSASGSVIGIVSKTDLVNTLRFRESEKFSVILGPAITVGDIMTYDVVTVTPDTSVREIAQLMVDQEIHRVLVGSRKNVVGIISAFDLLELVH
ncbi:MAG: CBS domain-containing protein [Gammaproteobacteria bacterium]|nr:CBS domain-containing protein [Gammaproteobacteria bacterium]